MRIAFKFSILLLLLFISGCHSNVHVRPSQYDVYIDISPDNRFIVFNATGKGGSDLYILRLSDNNISNITYSDNYETTPSFSPDGKSIVYASGLPGDKADHIFICNADGSNRRQITNVQYNDGQPSFAPDGKSIVFTRNHQYAFGGFSTSWPGEMDIYIVNISNSEVNRITHQLYDWIYTPRFLSNKSIIYSAILNSDTAQQLEKNSRFRLKENKEMINEMNLYRVDVLDKVPSSPQFITVEGNAAVIDYSVAKKTFPACISGQLKIFHFDNNQLTTNSIKKIPKNDIRSVTITPDSKHIYFLTAEPIPTPDSVKPNFADAFALWSIEVDGNNLRQIADPSLFDAPSNWNPKKLHTGK